MHSDDDHNDNSNNDNSDDNDDDDAASTANDSLEEDRVGDPSLTDDVTAAGETKATPRTKRRSSRYFDGADVTIKVCHDRYY
jgi:hypothetical protein